jgi:exonuclease III
MFQGFEAHHRCKDIDKMYRQKKTDTTDKGKERKNSVLRFGCQNTRTMKNRRSAIVAKALQGRRCDVVALSETRLDGEGVIQEGKMTIHHYGNAAGSDKQGQGGVGIALSKRAERLLHEVKVVSTRVIAANFTNRVTFIAVYAPTHSSAEQRTTQKAEFYSQLQEAIDSVPRKNMIMNFLLHLI